MMRRKLPFWATFLTLIGVIILCALGTWQVKRLAWKNDIVQKLHTAYASSGNALSFNTMKENDFAIITGGKNIGEYGKIVEIESEKVKKRRNASVIIEDEKGNRYQTILNFVFAIGEKQPLISIPEATKVV